MSALILRHSWTRQPQVPVEIDPGFKPISVYIPARKLAANFLDGTVPCAHNGAGLCSRYDASESQREYVSRNGAVNGLKSLTLIVVLTPSAGGTDFDRGVMGNWSSTVANSYLQIVQRAQSYGGAEYQWRVFYKPTSASSQMFLFSPNNTAIAGVRYAFVVTVGNDSLELFSNGTLAAGASVATPEISGQTDILLGNYYDNEIRRRLRADVEFAAVLGDKLNVNQALSVSKNPYQLLRPMQRRLWVVGEAAVGTDNLTATDLVIGSPVLGTPALGQVHALTATALTVSGPVLGSPSLGQIHSLVAPALVVGSPALGTPALTENAADVDALTADNLVVGLPVLGIPPLGQIHVLGSDGLAVSSPALGTPSLEIGKDHLTAQDLAIEGPVLGTPALRQIHALVASFSTAAPEIGAPALTQAHAIIPVNLAAGSPVLGTPMLFDLEYMLQTRAELKSLGTTDFTSPLYGATHIELRCYGNYEVNEFGE